MKTIRQVIVLLLLIFLFFSLTKTIFDYRNTLTFYQTFKSDYERAQHENIALKTQILKKSDDQELEKTIRNKLNLLKQGEVAIIVPMPTPTPTVITPTPAPVYMQWKSVFVGN